MGSKHPERDVSFYQQDLRFFFFFLVSAVAAAKVKQYGVCHNEMEPDGDQSHIRSEGGVVRGRQLNLTFFTAVRQTATFHHLYLPVLSAHTYTHIYSHIYTHTYSKREKKTKCHLKSCLILKGEKRY